ncbi:MAG: malate dehydrogenase, partial [Methylococcales bacterium]
EQMRTWVSGTTHGDWVSMAIPSDGSYGITKGLIYSYPVTCQNENYTIVQGLDINTISREHMKISEKELIEEKKQVKSLLLLK